jgi:5-oxoprolinase (ATP-hydrolysing)
VLLEVFNNLFMNIAEQMGLQLQNTAYSVNIKERLDFSCALFDAAGNLIANAPHMPVHLGSMGESIRTVIDRNRGAMHPGDVYVLNDPYHGGTHLPDITVITPVYLDGHAEPDFYVGSRGHHADIGGITPGSMPPFSTRIEEEGVQLDNVKLVDRGRLRESEIRICSVAAPSPGRPRRRSPSGAANHAQRVAVPQPQPAAEPGRPEGPDRRQRKRRAGAAQDGGAVRPARRAGLHAARAGQRRGMRAPRHRQAGGAGEERALHAAAGQRRADPGGGGHRRRAAHARIDFSGTSPQQANNFNAPTAVGMAAVLYVFRILVDDDIPLNAGCLKPIEVVIPEGSMLRPEPPASVVAGNVETSTCITNALIGALGLMGSSQCTLNNFTFGNAEHQYYETISGGSGAGGEFDDQGRLVGGFDGTSVVQTHMSNSRLTDPEVLEWRFPVRLESYEIRSGSGGAGRWRGGDGGVRRLRFLQPMTASILSNGRVHGAFGMAGGGAGAVGINRVLRADGRVQELRHIGSAEMQPGDIFEIHTPVAAGLDRARPDAPYARAGAPPGFASRGRPGLARRTAPTAPGRRRAGPRRCAHPGRSTRPPAGAAG